MPKASPIFPSFAAGEVSPLMFGRVDLAQYFIGLETAENCLVRPYGLIMNRPGSQFIAPTKDPTKESRLIEFVFNPADSFTIEFGESYFRFFTLGAPVTETAFTITGATQTDPVVVTTSAPHGYSIGDEIIITGVVGMAELNNRRFRLSAGTATTFDIEDLDGVDVDGTGFGAYVSGGSSAKIFEVVHTYTESEIPDVHFAQVNDVIFLVHPLHEPATLTRLALTNWVLADIDFIKGPVQDTNATATTITPSADSGLGITLTASASLFDVGMIGGIFRIGNGFVTITAFATDVSVTADVDVGDNLGTGPGATTDWAEGSWSDFRGFPATLTFHERRAWYARTNFEPQTAWASRPFIFDEFQRGVADDDAIIVTLNTELANDIKWLSSGTILAAGTFGGEFVIASGITGETLTPSNTNSTRQSGWGSLNIQPKKIANFTYYIQRAGRKIREFFFFFDLDTFKSVDMTILSEQITDSQIKAIAYQQNPDSVLWNVRNDGQIATMTREEDQKVLAWTRQVTDGDYESCVTIPSNEGPSDEVWTIVKRTINGVTRRYVERFKSPVVPDRQEDSFYVDSGLSFDAYALTTANSLTLSAVTGLGVTVTAGAAIFQANDVGQRIRAVDANKAFVGELLITGFTSSTVVTGDVVLDFDSTAYIANRWGVSATVISGFNHLEAKTLSILGDGAVQTQQVVASGDITLERDAFEVMAGLPYTATIQTLSVEAGSATGTAQGNKKRIYELALRVFKTLGIKVGGSTDKLFDVNLRDPQTLLGLPESLVTGITPNIRFTGGWVYEGKVVITQELPLPMHILGIMPLLKQIDK